MTGPHPHGLRGNGPLFDPDNMRALATQINDRPALLVITDAGHFVQERGDIIATAALDYFLRR